MKRPIHVSLCPERTTYAAATTVMPVHITCRLLVDHLGDHQEQVGFSTVYWKTGEPAQRRYEFDRECACEGCWACEGHELGCTCDIDWDELAERQRP